MPDLETIPIDSHDIQLDGIGVVTLLTYFPKFVEAISHKNKHETSKRILRHSQNLLIPSTRTKIIMDEGAKLCNLLPKYIKNSKSLLLFKN